MPKAKVLPCKCGHEPELYYTICESSSFGGQAGFSWYNRVRMFRYVCPNCHEWGRPYKRISSAKRDWNMKIKNDRKNYWHNADLEPEKLNWWKPLKDAPPYEGDIIQNSVFEECTR